MSVGVEYQVVKRGREYHGCGKNNNAERRESGSNIIFPIILRRLGRINSRTEGEMVGRFWAKYKF